MKNYLLVRDIILLYIILNVILVLFNMLEFI